MLKPSQPVLQNGYSVNRALTAAWLMNEGGGQTLFDSSGRRINGQFLTAPVWTSGPTGRALSFTTNQAVKIYNGVKASCNAYLQNFASGDCSISAWIKTSQASIAAPFPWTAGSVIIEARSWGDDPPYCWCLGVSSNKLSFALTNANVTSNIFTSNTSVNDGLWHHVAATRMGTATTLYLDGRIDKTGVITTGSNFSTGQTANSIEIGLGVRGTDAGTQTANFYTGLMSDVRLFNRGLLADEVRFLYEATFNEWKNQFNPELLSVGAAAASTARERRTLSAIGNRVGSRQMAA